MVFLKKSTAVLLVASGVILFVGAGCRKGTVIEELGDHVVTTEEFNEFYNTKLEILTRSNNVSKETVGRALCTPDSREGRFILEHMDPERAYRSFRDQHIVHQVARQDGFLDRPHVKRILEQVMLQMAVQLYMQEKMEKYIRFSQEKKEEKCRELRQQDPARFGPLPLDQCVSVAERYLTDEEYRKRYPQLVEEVKERVAVKKNNQFNKEEYLKKQVDGYRVLRKSGGCPVDDAAPTGGAKSAPEDRKDPLPVTPLGPKMDDPPGK